MSSLATQKLLLRIKQQQAEQQEAKRRKELADAEAEAKLRMQPAHTAVASAVATALPPLPISEASAGQIPEAPEHAVMLGKGAITRDMLNARQKRAVRLGEQGLSFVTTGAAGTGKTTVTRHTLAATMASGRIGSLDCGVAEFEHPYLAQGGPAVAVISYTNVATNNIKAILPPDLARHTMTAHKFLAYMPEDMDFDTYDEFGNEDGIKTVTRFRPSFGKEPDDFGGSGLGCGTLLPHFDLIVIEESGTMPVWLFMTIVSALPDPENTQFIFLGDIEQLAPAFGDGILGYKMLELPRIELVETYRNIGLVTKFAHRILSGRELGDKEAESWNLEDESGRIELRQFKQERSTWEQALKGMGTMFRKMAKEGNFNPDNTMLLIPFNVKFGTDEMGKYIAQGFTDQDYKPVWEVIAGRVKVYLCVGDRLFINKAYYELVAIEPTKNYSGETARPPMRCMDRWGRIRSDVPDYVLDEEREAYSHYMAAEAGEVMSEDDIDNFLSMTAEDLKGAASKASHTLFVKRVNTANNLDDAKDAEQINSIGTIRDMRFSYALTVFKAQGSEWENVHCIFHSYHSSLCYREQLYTAVTRARRNVTVWYDGDRSGGAKNSMLRKGITNQSIPGSGIEEKLNYFRKKLGIKTLSLTEIMKLNMEQKALDKKELEVDAVT